MIQGETGKIEDKVKERLTGRYRASVDSAIMRVLWHWLT